MNELMQTLRDLLFGPKDRPMNKGLKWAGIAIVVLILIGIISETTTQRAAEFFGWIAIASVGLVLVLEPSLPKRDRRFKTGFKDNATPKKKTKRASQIQTGATVAGIIAGALWFVLGRL